MRVMFLITYLPRSCYFASPNTFNHTMQVSVLQLNYPIKNVFCVNPFLDCIEMIPTRLRMLSSSHKCNLSIAASSLLLILVFSSKNELNFEQ